MSARIMAAALATGLAFAGPPALAATYSFEQTGWNDATSPFPAVPGTLSFTFTGTDANNDGFLTGGSSLPGSEITAFSLSWSGNALLPAFNSSLSDVVLLVFPLSGLGFAAANAALIVQGTNEFALSGGAAGSAQCAGATLCGFIASASPSVQLFSLQAPTTVPEPASLALLGLGLAGLGTLRRRRAA